MSIKKNVVTTYELKDCKIISVEAGNVNKVDTDKTVVAFTVEGDKENTWSGSTTTKYKILLKGKQAHTIYNLFLAGGNTVTKTMEDIRINKTVTVSLNASVREIRNTEVVLENAVNVEFDFNYKLID